MATSRSCTVCGARLKGLARKYCSEPCRREAERPRIREKMRRRRAEAKAKKQAARALPSVHCRVCGQPFIPYHHRGRPTTICSDECRREQNRRKARHDSKSETEQRAQNRARRASQPPEQARVEVLFAEGWAAESIAGRFGRTPAEIYEMLGLSPAEIEAHRRERASRGLVCWSPAHGGIWYDKHLAGDPCPRCQQSPIPPLRARVLGT